MKRAALAVLAVFAFGCEAVHQVRIESDPPGAHIEVNGDYIGETPVLYTFKSPLAEQVWPYNTEIQAYPPDPGYPKKSKQFRQHSQLQKRIMFFMDYSDPEPRTPTYRFEHDHNVSVQGDVDLDVDLKKSDNWQ